jgi:hypothetical protein
MGYEIKDNGLMEFDKEKIVGVAKVEMPLTEYDIDNIMVSAIEGGIGYWACLVNNTPEWADKPKNIASSQWATKLLLEGNKVLFEDEEDGKKLTLTLDKLIKGFEKNFKERPWDNDLEKGDANTSDCIVQYSLFGEVVYG